MICWSGSSLTTWYVGQRVVWLHDMMVSEYYDYMICWSASSMTTWYVGLRVVCLCSVTRHWVWLHDVLVSTESVMSFCNKNCNQHHLGPWLKVQCHEVFGPQVFQTTNVLKYFHQLPFSFPSFPAFLLDSMLTNTVQSRFFWISLQKWNYLQNHFSVLHRVSGFDSWKKKIQKISWHFWV